MGRPIQKKWFRALDRGTNADLTVTTQSGDEPIILQKGTGVYDVASGRVRLTDGAPSAANECQLQHDGKNVNKITQFRVFYFSGGSAVWRDKNSNILGIFNPDLTVEDILNIATATATVANGAITGYIITLGGAEYTSAPVVTISAPNGTSSTATGSFANGIVSGYVVTNGGSGYASVPAVTVGAPDGTSASVAGTVAVTGGPAAPDADQSAMISDGGTGYAVAPVVSQTGGTGTGSVFTAVLTNGIVTSITATAGNSDYVGDETLSITAVVLTQETATATLTNSVVTNIATNVTGAGYASNPSVTVAAVTLTQETATATITGDAVTAIATNVPGAGYISATATVAAP